MEEEAEKMKDDDLKLQQMINLRNKAENLIF